MLSEPPLWPALQAPPRAPGARRGARASRRRRAVGIVAVGVSLMIAAGGAYALGPFGPFGPDTQAADPQPVAADARAAVAGSAALRADLVGGIKAARAVQKSPDGKAAAKPERQKLDAAIEDAGDLVTSLEAVASSPSGTATEVRTVLERTSALHQDAPAVTAALRDATAAVVASGRQVRQDRAAEARTEDAPAAVRAQIEGDDAEVDGTGPAAGDTGGDRDGDAAVEGADDGTGTTTPAGTCPEPDQVWSAENGHLSSSELAQIPFASGHSVRADVVGGLAELNEAFAAEFGVNLTINSSYRTYAEQESLFDPSSRTAAPPGCSNHGTGLAIDIGGGVEAFGSARYDWLKANAEAYGWVHPPFAEPSGRNPEPWHWQSVQAPNSY
ncbi:D-alanyl-D-alanine carboxypeptidase family protein [Promicromonospora sp. NFX87]|uniref:D-alanyl-D-alanine carboxypeptidase family protein n=1 Tax=Promicromonospora sp. NFX87 TaxID=3402691 RepID=UPI003AFAD311